MLSNAEENDMKTVLAAVLVSVVLVAQIVLVAQAECQELPKLKVAVVNLNRISNSGINYDKIRLLSMDKPTLEALQKIGREIQDVQMQITDVEDELKLADLGRRLEFLNRKSSLLRQRVMNNDTNRDVQSLIRGFVIDKFKDKYPLILQQQDGNPDRTLWKGGDVEVNDITDEVQEKFREYVDELSGMSSSAPPFGMTGRPYGSAKSDRPVKPVPPRMTDTYAPRVPDRPVPQPILKPEPTLAPPRSHDPTPAKK